jgi:hypothetical protein
MARADRIYRSLLTLEESRRRAAALIRDFQVIVVDNDLPPGYGNKFNKIELSVEEPLVKV